LIRAVLSTALLTAMASSSFAATEVTIGERLPELRGEYLSGRKAILPGDASGRIALLLLGFSYQSRFAVEAWTNRFREEFEKNPQVTFYEMPMIGGMARLGKWFIDSGMRRGTPKADRENVITVYGGTEAWKQRLGVTAEDWAYLILIDRKGNIAWRHAGLFEPAPFQALAERVRRLASAP
jgi:hypothetical protein